MHLFLQTDLKIFAQMMLFIYFQRLGFIAALPDIKLVILAFHNITHVQFSIFNFRSNSLSLLL